jgi:hypothetical protein
MTTPDVHQADQAYPSEPDWRAYAQRLEQRVAALSVEIERYGATIDTLSVALQAKEAHNGTAPGGDLETNGER